MIDLSLLADPDMSSGLFAGFLTFVSIAAVVLILPFYLELVMGLDQQEVGMLMAVVPIVLGVLGPLAGILSDRAGTRPVAIAGLALLVVGYFTLSRLTVHSQPLDFVLALLPVGLGMGIFQTPNNTSIMNAAPRSRLGIASGMLSMSRTLGQSAGIALLSAYFAIRLAAYAGGAVDINAAQPADIVNAMRDQFYVTMCLILLGLAVILGQGWRARRTI
jgi:MFS family permease